MIKYVIFDMDGTLIDTEPIFEKAWNEIGKKWGFDGIDKLYCQIVGRSVDTIIELLERTYGTEKDCRAFFSERQQYFTTLIEHGVPFKPGCMELLRFLKANNIRTALATSTPMYIVEKNMRNTGIDEYIDEIVTSEMVVNGKPAPDIFLEAGKRIGAIKEECIVCEDSYNGIIAAHAAGMKPVMIPDMLPPTKKTDAMVYKTCSDLFEVMELIKEENKNN